MLCERRAQYFSDCAVISSNECLEYSQKQRTNKVKRLSLAIMEHCSSSQTPGSFLGCNFSSMFISVIGKPISNGLDVTYFLR